MAQTRADGFFTPHPSSGYNEDLEMISRHIVNMESNLDEMIAHRNANFDLIQCLHQEAESMGEADAAARVLIHSRISHIRNITSSMQQEIHDYKRVHNAVVDYYLHQIQPSYGPFHHDHILTLDQDAQFIQAQIDHWDGHYMALRHREGGSMLARICGIPDFEKGLLNVQRSLAEARRAHNYRARLYIRHLKLHDLPTELLLKIAEFVGGDYAAPTARPVPVDDRPDQWQAGLTSSLPHMLYNDRSGRRDLQNLQNLRLTCKGLSQVGAAFLIPVLNITLTTKSLERAKLVSEHAAISKSVRHVQIHTTNFSPNLAQNRNVFGGWCVDWITLRLSERRSKPANSWTLCYPMTHHPMSEGRLEALATNLMVYGRGHDGESSDTYMALNGPVTAAHTEYQRRYMLQQAMIEDDTFVHAVAAAFALMPQVRSLYITDLKNHVIRGPWAPITDEAADQELNFQSTPDSPAGLALRETLISATHSTYLQDEDGQYESRHTSMTGIGLHLMVRLPIAIAAAAESPLQELHVNHMCPWQVAGFTTDFVQQVNELRRACRQLKTFRLVHYALNTDDFDESEPPRLTIDDKLAYKQMLVTYMSSPELRVLQLVPSYYMWPYDRERRPYITFRWCRDFDCFPSRKLQRVQIHNIHFTLSALRRFLDRLPNDVAEVNLGYLHLEKDASWGKALDILRNKATQTTIPGESQWNIENIRGGNRTMLRLYWADPAWPMVVDAINAYVQGWSEVNPLILLSEQEATALTQDSDLAWHWDDISTDDSSVEGDEDEEEDSFVDDEDDEDDDV